MSLVPLEIKTAVHKLQNVVFLQVTGANRTSDMREPRFGHPCHLASNGKGNDECRIGKDLLVGTERKHRTHHLGQTMTGPISNLVSLKYTCMIYCHAMPFDSCDLINTCPHNIEILRLAFIDRWHA
jgi:hypothetical protein